MSDENPSAILYDALGRPLAVQDAVAIPANTPRLLFAGKDVSGNARTVGVTPNGYLISLQASAPTGTLSTVAASVSSGTLLAANPLRVGFSVYNDSVSETLYMALASGASLTSFTLKVAPSGYYESPIGFTYIGIVTGVWSAAIGNARITEYSLCRTTLLL